MLQAIDEQNEVIKQEGTDSARVLQLLDEAADHARTILKDEWERVKRGEWPFRIARYSATAVIIAVLCFMGALVSRGLVQSDAKVQLATPAIETR